jgi:hypothetical protein
MGSFRGFRFLKTMIFQGNQTTLGREMADMAAPARPVV